MSRTTSRAFAVGLVSLAAAAAASAIGCAPSGAPPKSAADWHDAVGHAIEAKRPEIQGCYEAERKRVKELAPSPVKDKLVRYLDGRVVFVLDLSVGGSAAKEGKLSVFDVPGQGTNSPDDPAGEGKGNGGGVDGPLWQCVTKLVETIPAPFAIHNGWGQWRIVLDPSVSAASPADGPGKGG